MERWDVLRGGLKVVLGELGVETVGSVANGSAAVAAVAEARPDFVLVAACADVAETALVRRLVRISPGTRCLVLVDTADPRYDPVVVLDAGAMALAPRSATIEELGEALGRLLRGDRYVAGSALTGRRTVLGTDGGGVAENELTARERAVLGQLAAGASNREIALALFVGVGQPTRYLR